jgi:hypothetical protein
MRRAPMWRPSEGDPCCAVTRSSIGHLVDNSKSRPFFLVGVAKSSESLQIIDFDAIWGPRPEKLRVGGGRPEKNVKPLSTSGPKRRKPVYLAGLRKIFRKIEGGTLPPACVCSQRRKRWFQRVPGLETCSELFLIKSRVVGLDGAH